MTQIKIEILGSVLRPVRPQNSDCGPVQAPTLGTKAGRAIQAGMQLKADEIRCGGCGAAVHKDRKKCPHCGQKLKPGCLMTVFQVVITLLGLFLLLRGMGLL